MLNNKALKERVEALLISKPDLREDDQRILANIWHRELGAEKLGKISAFELLEMISKGELTHFEAVRRTRQKLQEHNPALRGPNYQKRHSKSSKIKREMRSFQPSYQFPIRHH